MNKSKKVCRELPQLIKGFLKKESKIWLLFWRAAGAGMFFLLTLIMTNYLDEEVFGAFEYGRSALMLLGSIALFGTDRSILQFFGRLKVINASGDIFLVYLKMVYMLVAISIFLICFYFVIPKNFWLSLFSDYQGYKIVMEVVLGLFFYTITLLNTEYYRVLDRMILSELFRGVFKYTPLAIIVLGVLVLDDSTYLFECYMLGFLVLAVVSTLLVFLLKNPLSRRTAIKKREILLKSYPMAISSLGFLLLTTIDIYFLKRYTSLEQVAIYAIPVKITMLLNLVFTTMQAAIATEISSLFYSGNMKLLQKRIKRVTNAVFVITFPLLLITYAFGSSILAFFGPTFLAGRNALSILLIGFLFSTLSSLSPIYLNMTGREKKLQAIIFLTVLCNLCLNYYLIPIYGIEGAATASSISMALWTTLSLGFIYLKDSIKVFAHF